MNYIFCCWCSLYYIQVNNQINTTTIYINTVAPNYITFIYMLKETKKAILHGSPEDSEGNQQKKDFKKVKLRLVIKYPLSNLQFFHNYRNALYINDQALRNPEESEATIFQGSKQFQKIKKIQANRHFFTIKFDNLQEQKNNIDYMIQRFLSFGDSYFQTIAKKIIKFEQNIQQIMIKVKQTQNLSWKQSYKEILNQYADKKAYMIIWQPSQKKNYQITTIKFSHQFLEMLGQDSQSLSVSLLQHQVLQLDVFNPDVYKTLLMAHLDSINIYADKILNGELSPHLDLAELTEKKFYFEFIRRDQGKILAQVKVTMPHIFLHVGQVTKIIKQDPHPRMQRRMQQITTIKQYETVPSTIMQSNKLKVCQYRDIQPSE